MIFVFSSVYSIGGNIFFVVIYELFIRKFDGALAGIAYLLPKQCRNSWVRALKFQLQLKLSIHVIWSSTKNIKNTVK